VRGQRTSDGERGREAIDESDFLLNLTGSDAGDDSDSVALPRGSYQLRSSPVSVVQRHHLYTWLASAAEYPVQDAVSDTGDVSEVMDLGTLGPSGIRVGGYVGALDPRDTYRIQLAQSARVVLEFLDATGGLQARVFRDAPALDDDSSLFRVVGLASATEPLEPGVYLVRVSGLSVTERHFLYTLAVGLAP
jgi:hypothetical protein